MTEETKEAPPTEAPVVEGETKPENGKKQYKRDPVEELFDLTKPIPRVREPHDFLLCLRRFLRNSNRYLCRVTACG